MCRWQAEARIAAALATNAAQLRERRAAFDARQTHNEERRRSARMTCWHAVPHAMASKRSARHSPTSTASSGRITHGKDTMCMHFGGPTSVCLSCGQHRSWQLDNSCMGSARSLMGCLHPSAMLRGCAHGKRRQKEAQREAEEMHKRVQEAEAEAARKGTYAAALAREAVRVASIQVRLAAWRGSGRQDKLAQHTALHDSVLLAQPTNRTDRCRHCQAACASGRVLQLLPQS